MARKLIVEILGDASSLERTYARAEKSTRSFGREMSQVGRGSVVAAVGFHGLGRSIAYASGAFLGAAGLVTATRAAFGEMGNAQRASAQTAAVLRSTGGVAGVTAKNVDQLASSLLNVAGIDDEATKAAENLLLTFTNVRNVVGKGNDIFNQATRATADLATRMNQGATPSAEQLSTAAIQIGKALQDPIRGMTALRRVGISFTEAQQKQIKRLVESGDVLEAQRVILRELRTEMGGAAKAAGDTLPGQIDKLREKLRNLGGSIAESVAPALTSAIDAVNRFVDRLGKARTVRAKFRFVFEGLENVGQSLVSLISSSIDRIDFSGIGSRVGDKLKGIRWGFYIEQAGRAVGDALATVFNKLADALNSVNWVAVGKAIVDGLVVAIAAVVKFLISIDWGSVAKALARAFVADLKAQFSLLIGVAGELGRLVVGAISAGLIKAGRNLEKTALELVLKIIEPFTHLPGWLGGGPFQALKTKFQGMLDELASQAQKGGRKIAGNLQEGLTFEGLGGAVQKAVDAATKGGAGKGAARPGGAAPPTSGLAPTPRAGVTAAQRNAWFDAMISRELGQVQDIPTLRGQITRLGVIAQQIRARYAITRDITRRLHLEDQLLGVLRTQRTTRASLSDELKQRAKDAADAAKAAQQAAADTARGWLDFAIQRAEATKTVKDDLRAYRTLETWLKARIQQEGRTLELVRDLWATRQKIRDLNKSKADVDPLAGLMQVSSKQLANILAAGTGLGVSGRRRLGANIAGAEIQPLTVHNHIHLDGAQVAESVTKHQARSSRRTANQTSGHRG